MPDHQTGPETIEPDSTSPAARVGAGLREMRERLGWKLPEVAEGLRIRAEFLTAIERGDLSSLPGPAYRAGFVRSYAQALGLDGEEILRRFRDAGQLGQLPKSEIQFLAPVPDRGVPKGAIVLIGIVVVLAGYGLWYRHTEQERRLSQAVPQVPAELQPLATPPKVTPPSPPAAPPASVVPPASAVPPSLAAASAPQPQQAQQAPANPAQPGAQPGAQPAKPAQAASPNVSAANIAAQPEAASGTPAAIPASAAPPISPAMPGAGMQITATQDAWVQVTDPSGNILFSKVMHPGDSWPVPQLAGLKMTTGNAGGTIITTDGKPGQPLGTAGVVLHNYQLTPAAGASPAAPASTPAPAGTSPAPGAAQ